MQKGIIGKKLGMTQLFDENGKVVPVTVIEAGPCTVVQKKTVESDGYEAVQLGFGEVSAKKVNKAAKGHFDKADVAPKRTLREFRLDDISGMNVGDILKADVFAAVRSLWLYFHPSGKNPPSGQSPPVFLHQAAGNTARSSDSAPDSGAAGTNRAFGSLFR